jgi:putative MATE family efflux protein
MGRSQEQHENLYDFILETLENRHGAYKRIVIGYVHPSAQKRIEELCHAKVSEIDIDNSGIVHAVTKVHHNLSPDDLLDAVDVINTATDISLSGKKHKDNDVLVFSKDIDGEITFLTEVHVTNDYLMIFDAWRKKKARRDPTVRRPRADVQDEPPRAFDSLSHQSAEMSSGFSENNILSQTKPPLFTNRALLRLIWPLVVEQTLVFTLGFADIAMVSSLGEAAVSGVSLVDTISILITDVFAALATGGAVVASHYIGGRDLKAASETAKQLLQVLVVIGLACMAAGMLFMGPIIARVFGNITPDVAANANTYFWYMLMSYPLLALYNGEAALFRAQGNSLVSMYTSLLVNVVNIGGNALCIFVLHWGVAGVAIPTLAARGMAALVLFVLLHRKAGAKSAPNFVLSVRGILKTRPNVTLVKHILAIGVPNGIENSMFQLGKLLVFTVITGFGTGAIAANAAAGSLSTFSSIPVKAAGLALLTVVGQSLGARDPDAAVKYTHKLIFAGYIAMAVINLPLLFLGPRAVGLFGLSGETAALTLRMFSLHLYCLPFWPPSFALPNALRAANDARFTMCVSLASVALIRVGFSFFFARFFPQFGAMGVWYAMILDWVVRSVFFITRFERGAWRKHYQID